MTQPSPGMIAKKKKIKDTPDPRPKKEQVRRDSAAFLESELG